MAIAIRGGSPATNGTAGSPSVTLTGTHQPQTNDVLVIIHGNDFYAATNLTTPTVGGSTAGVAAISGGAADAGNNQAHIKSYTYVVGSTGDLTVAAVETGTADEEKCLVVYVLSGVDTSTPIDVAANNVDTGGATTHVAPSVSPTSSSAYLICHSNDGSGNDGGASSPPAGMAEQYDASVGGFMSYTGATVQLVASGATGTKLFIPTGGASYASVSIAVKTAAAGAAPTFPPYWEGRRRLLVTPRFPRAHMSTPTRAQVNPPFPFVEFHQPRRQRGQNLRRGEAFMPVPAQVVVPPPAYPPQSVRTRLRGLRLFRGHTATPIPAQVTPPPLVYVPQAVRGRLKLPAIRRHDIAPPIVDQSAPPVPLISRVKLRIGRALHRSTPVAPAPPMVPPPRRPRPVELPPRRGRATAPIPAATPQIPPPWPLNFIRNARHWLRPRRGRPAAPGLPQSTPSVVRDIVLEIVGPDPKWVAAAAPHRWDAEPHPRTWAASTTPSRWEVDMPVTPETISSGSLVYVRRAIRNKVNGVSVDITGDTVKMAFMTGSAAPQASDLKTASWETDATSVPSKYLARCLVGPAGTVTLNPGMYEVWVQVTDSPEIPLLPAGPLRVT